MRAAHPGPPRVGLLPGTGGGGPADRDPLRRAAALEGANFVETEPIDVNGHLQHRGAAGEAGTTPPTRCCCSRARRWT